MEVQTLRLTLLSGNPILAFDSEGREGETDIVFYAANFSWRNVGELRREAGGGLPSLLCHGWA